MTARLERSASLGACLPGALTLQSVALTTLQGQLDGAVAAQAALTIQPPSLAANLALAQQLVAAIETAIVVGVPSVDFQVSAIASTITLLQAQLSALDLGLGAGGVALYTFRGNAGTMGSELAGVIGAGPPGSAPNSPAGAVVLAASAPAALAALAAFCGVSL